MRFPQSERVIFRKNPLAEVICQIRFPRQFEIESELPVRFQKGIKDSYPLLSTREEQTINVGIVQDGSDIDTGKPKISTSLIYDFTSLDGTLRVSLSSNFVALTSLSYTSWQDFKREAHQIISLAADVYRPEAVTRVGLRYRNLIVRELLGVEDQPWRRLLSTHIAGILVAEETSEDDIKGYESMIRVAVECGDATIRHGLVVNAATKQKAYLIDCDFSNETVQKWETDDVINELDNFHTAAGNFFRWAITDTLHAVMEPTPRG